MGFSPLTNGTAPHHNKFNSRNGRGISRIIVHHWAGTAGGDSRLTNPSADVSANYILYSNGTLIGQVPEEYRAWTSGSWEVDSPSITIEVQNSGVGGDWPVSDAAINKLTQLIADLGRRYGWGSISFGAQVRGHREFVATACPGPYLWARLPQIAANANAQMGGAAPAPSAPVSGDVDALARAVIRGDYGNGPARRAALGARYDEVQARVNQILSGGGSAPAPAPAPVPAPNNSIDALARAVIRGDYGNGPTRKARLGAMYGPVQARVNEILGGSAPAPAPAPAPAVDIEGLARAVIRGDYGNGDARRAALGANYDAVQARVNQILGGGAPAPAPAPAVDIEGLARAVIRGEYGNGQDRRNRLGANYDAVQARVNQILGM